LSFFCRRAISSAAANINLWSDTLGNLNFVCKCIEDTIDGLQDGLSHFSGSSRAAVIYAITPDGPMRICDPQKLLRGHEPIFEELNIVSGDWRYDIRPSDEIKKFQHMVPEKNLELAPAYGARKKSGIGRSHLLGRPIQFRFLPDVVYRASSGHVLHRPHRVLAGTRCLAVFP
jgi:hypothetical protein